MVSAAADELVIRYEGPGSAGELIGGTQANFIVLRPQPAATEVAVIINSPATAYLAEALGQPDTPEFREAAARVVGRIWLNRRVERTGLLESISVVSRASFEEDSGLLDAVKRMVSAHP